MRTPNCKYSRRNSYLQVGIHRGRPSTFGEKFTVVTRGKTFGKRHCAWGAQKPYEIRADTSIDFQALTRSFHTCSKRLLFEHPYYRKFTGTCGCNPYYLARGEVIKIWQAQPGLGWEGEGAGRVYESADRRVLAWEEHCRSLVEIRPV